MTSQVANTRQRFRILFRMINRLVGTWTGSIESLDYFRLEGEDGFLDRFRGIGVS